MSPFKSLKVAFAAAVLAVGLPVVASAQNKVSSPDINKGVMELEYRGSVDNDDLASRDGAHAQKGLVNYAFTDRFRVEGKAVWTGLRNNIDLTGMELAGRYQVFKAKEAPIRLSLQANYKFALVNGKSDKLEGTILAARDMGKFTHMTNINFEREVGAHSKPGVDFNFGVKEKYRLHKRFEPGAEVYADFGKFGVNDPTPNKILAGPAVTGLLAKNLKYDVAYLFGTDHSVVPTGRLRVVLTYAFKPKL